MKAREEQSDNGNDIVGPIAPSLNFNHLIIDGIEMITDRMLLQGEDNEEGDAGETGHTVEVDAAPKKAPLPRTPCLICEDQFVAEGLSTLPCGHRYCFECVVETFTRSFVDEELYPPRCCQQPITLESLDTHLTPELEITFYAKGVEYATMNRIYCSSPECGVFLTSDMFTGPDVAQCSICQTTTCTLCKGGTHEGDCPEDEGVNQLEALAEANGWKRCPTCQRMVELELGCYHMS